MISIGDMGSVGSGVGKRPGAVGQAGGATSFDAMLRQAMAEPEKSEPPGGDSARGIEAAAKDKAVENKLVEDKAVDAQKSELAKERAEKDGDTSKAAGSEDQEESGESSDPVAESTAVAASGVLVGMAADAATADPTAEEGGESPGEGTRVQWQQPAQTTDEQTSGDNQGSEGDGEGAEPAAVAVEVDAEPSVFELLDADELADPQLRVEATPNRLIERLQQSLGTSAGSAVAEEAAEIVVPQVVRGVATLVRDGMAEMRLQLQPGDLGQIEVRVKATEGIVRAELMVQHNEVKQLLEGQSEKLRAALSQQGLELEGFDVDLSGGGNGRQAGDTWDGVPRGPGQAETAGRGGGVGAAVEGAAPLVAPVLGGGGSEVDYLA